MCKSEEPAMMCVCTIWPPLWQEERGEEEEEEEGEEDDDLGELQETVRRYDAATCRGSASRCLQGRVVLLFPYQSNRSQMFMFLHSICGVCLLKPTKPRILVFHITVGPCRMWCMLCFQFLIS